MRRILALAGLVAAAACGASPAAPSTPQHYALTAGTYTLNIFGAPVLAGGGSIMACASLGNVPTSIALPVTVLREGAVWVVQPASGTLKLTLSAVDGGVGGSLEGSASAGTLTVSVASPGTTASVSAPTLGVSYLTGPIHGDVRYAIGGAHASCNGNDWSLTPR